MMDGATQSTKIRTRSPAVWTIRHRARAAVRSSVQSHRAASVTRQHSAQQRQPGRIPRMQRKVPQVDRRRINHPREQQRKHHQNNRHRDAGQHLHVKKTARAIGVPPAGSQRDSHPHHRPGQRAQSPRRSSGLRKQQRAGGGLRPSSIVSAARTIADAAATQPNRALVARRNSPRRAAAPSVEQRTNQQDDRESARSPRRSGDASSPGATCRGQFSGDSDTSTSGSPSGARSRNVFGRGRSPAPSYRVRSDAGPSGVSST